VNVDAADVDGAIARFCGHYPVSFSVRERFHFNRSFYRAASGFHTSRADHDIAHMKSPVVSPLLTASAGFVALAVAIGVGRFAFTPVLPLMQDDFGLSVREGGWLAASNYIGYLAGSLCAAILRVRSSTVLRGGLVLIALTTALMAATTGFAWWLALRGAAGFVSAYVFIAVSAAVVGRLASFESPLLNATVYAGVGAGIAGAGLVCLAVMHAGLHADHAWIALGLFALVPSLVVWRGFPGDDAPDRAMRRQARAHTRSAREVRLVIAYGLCGFGYIVPATFLPAMAKHAIPDPAVFGWSWPIFGAAAAVSTFVPAMLPRRIDLRTTWIAAQTLMAAAVVMPVVSGGMPAIVVSALGVGGTFMVVTAAAMQESRRSVAPQHAAALIAVMTAAFAVGQIAGPLVVGAFAKHGGELVGPLVTASVLLLAGVALIAPRESRRSASNRNREETPE
jgi:predicted MFS family arabinose efflux permease